MCFQTIFEINSNSKTQASEVMRVKRSKDARLVEKFGKQKDSLAAEATLQQPVFSTTTDNEKPAYTVGEEDDQDELRVRNLKKIFWMVLKTCILLVVKKLTYSAFF